MSAPENIPDIMNDPAFDPTPNGSRKGSVDEADTCRICRSEASKEEPLFYPCKCSGSIKFVHQHCLVEWLSHSHKKHCELCKTPFHFTKLYDPNMPTTVPVLVFTRQVMIHTWRFLVAWSRLQLVAFVWLCWLPWSMRTVWRGLFWLGDGGWIDWVQLQEEALKAAKARTDQLAAEGSSPVSNSFFPSATSTTSAIMSRLADAFPHVASHTLNITKGEPVVFGLAKVLFRSIVGRHPNITTTPIPEVSSTNATHFPSIPFRSSWLSEVGFLKRMTRYPVMNNLVIDILEGQMITMFIVIAFILIFLIREWVVQQHPVMNLQAGPILAIEDAVAAANDPVRPDNDVPEAPFEVVAGPPDGDAEGLPVEEQVDLQIHRADINDQDVSGHQDRSNAAPRGYDSAEAPSDAEKISLERPDVSDSQQRPSMPDRGSLARAAEIRRTIEEQSRVAGPDWAGPKILMDLWARAENEPRQVSRIIQEEGRGEELAWIEAAMKRLEDIPLMTGDQEDPQHAAPLKDPITKHDTQPDKNMPIARPHDIDEAREIYGSDFDPANGLGGSNSLDETSNLFRHGFSVSEAVSREDNVNEAQEQSLQSDKSAVRSFPRDQPEDSTLATASTQLPHNSTAQVNNGHSTAQLSSTSEDLTGHGVSTDNPFHPDYAGPLPPYPEDESATGLPTVAANTVNPSTAEHDHSTQVAGTQATSINTGANGGLVEKIMTWLWGEPRPVTTGSNDQAAADVEFVVQDLANEAPFIPMEHGRPMLADHHVGDGDVGDRGPVRDAEAAADAGEAGLDPNDPEAVEEIEDLEGIMELVGMQGPIAGLIQNGMFCAVLVSLTIFLAIWIPYIIGKVFLIVLNNPVSLLCKMPLRYSKGLGDFLTDIVVFMLAYAYYLVATTVNFLCSPLRKFQPVSYLLHGDKILADVAKAYANRSATSLGYTFIATTDILSESDIPTFSIIAHESLRLLQQRVSQTGRALVSSAVAVCTSGIDPFQVYGYLKSSHDYQELPAVFMAKLLSIPDTLSAGFDSCLAWLTSLSLINTFSVNVATPARTQPLDFTLAYWDTRDRAFAILFGYLLFALLGVAYLDLAPLFQSKRNTGKVEGILAEILYQAGGVLKVILIISIEMIVFPLYCGILLDVALLPLFRNVSLLSRLEFMVNSPYTSLFVHWFVGTCYMFHFALFVSMCRKIMRAGVLYFIRDPDDPTFHPVRDVLERSVFTQLCKIAFSALVYGGLVIVCLGSVVWGISAAFEGVFPIHWSSNEPVLEFPVDLLFYDFLMPLAVKILQPSEGLAKMYGWWFRVCARGLRLSHFLFGDKREDEEGRHVRRTWRAVFAGKRGDTKHPVIGKERQQWAEDRGLDAYFLRDGRYVRTPASDQVRIPKGAHTFLEVDEGGDRVDGKADDDQGLHGRNNDHFATIYVPPRFRLRIGAFIGLLWLFAAATGICFTIIPLVFGRFVFSNIFPHHPRMNDIYAFCIGINILGGTVFISLNARSIIDYLRRVLVLTRQSNATIIFRKIARYGVRLVRVLYTYTAFGFFLPSLVALIPELYFVVPLHTYFGKGLSDRHVIYLIQDWTLGVLYVQMIGRFILWYEDSRVAVALRKVCRNGWTDPDVRLATRGFIFPATVLLASLLLTPLGAGWVVNHSVLSEADAALKSAVHRYSYPAFLALALGILATRYVVRAFKGWTRRMRDEVYLIGERLHNFGERRTVVVVGANRVAM
ncbi:MAG: hypothetical protein L6R40_000137 [Gallowayella cf. fulva]|nr:MAG: hypothetical protein L6R40_000137 [Xanthomendoza cf. fulva]